MNRVVVIEADLKHNLGHATLARKVRDEVEHQNHENYKVQSMTNLIASEQSTTTDDYPYVESFTSRVLIVFEQMS